MEKKENYKFLKVLVPLYVFDYEYIRIGEKEYEDEGIEDFVNEYPQTGEKYDQEDYLKIVIDLSNGNVINWPNDNSIDLFNYKLSDSGIYALMENEDGTGKVLQYSGYVPHCVGEEGMHSAGDYLEFEIDEECLVPNWKGFTDTDFVEFVDNCD